MKKLLMLAALGMTLVFTAAPKAEAYDHFVGTSETTGWDCFVITESISRDGDGMTYVTLKMSPPNGYDRYLGYRFWYDSSRDVMRFANDEGYSGIANRYETPIEWEMLQVIRQF